MELSAIFPWDLLPVISFLKNVQAFDFDLLFSCFYKSNVYFLINILVF